MPPDSRGSAQGISHLERRATNQARAGSAAEDRGMDLDRRASARESLALPIVLADGSLATTRNLSADGLFFTAPAGQQVDKWIRVEFSVASAGLKFTATGEVVRIERGELEDGVALRLHSQALSALD